MTWRCLDGWMDLDVTVNKFDGQNWESAAKAEGWESMVLELHGTLPQLGNDLMDPLAEGGHEVRQ